MIRALAVTGIVLVVAGTGLPSAVSAQTPLQGQTAGLLFLFGAPRAGGQASARSPGSGIAASPKGEDRIADVKQKPPSVKQEPVLARTGGGATVSIPDRVARPSGRRPDSTVLRVTSDQKNAPKVNRPVDLADRELLKQN